MPYSSATRDAMRRKSSSSTRVARRSAPDSTRPPSLPYMSMKLNMHVSVHSEASLQRRSNFLSW